MAQKQMETALLTEHLRYTPLALLDDIINTINELVARAVDAAEEGLSAADPAALGFAQKAAANNVIPDTDEAGNAVYPEAQREIEEGVHQLETLLEANVDKNFDKLELWVLRNVLSVPGDVAPWVRLAHYKDLTLPSMDPNDPPPTVQSLQLLRRKLQETRKLHAALLAEHTRNATLLSQLRSLLSPPTAPSSTTTSPTQNPPAQSQANLSFLTSTPSAHALGVSFTPHSDSASSQPVQPLSTNTSFALSQLPALRALLESLKPKVGALKSEDGDESFQESKAHERAVYVEGQARKAAERWGAGVGTGTEDQGRRVAREEVRALEGVVGILRGNDGDRMEE